MPPSQGNREGIKPFRVLSLDGGGMRGAYTATYLAEVAKTFARRRGVTAIDIGAGFDLITGTSTGTIVGCALAKGVAPDRIVDLYRDHGRQIFPRPVPAGIGPSLVIDFFVRAGALKRGEAALTTALSKTFGATTLGDIYRERNIALAFTAVELSQHRSWVFKTPHLKTKTKHRDDATKLVDVCLASTAAPVFRSIARVDRAGAAVSGGANYFVDGGLWSNNPVLVGLIDALEILEAEECERPIQIVCLGTCPLPAGEQVDPRGRHRGLGRWRFGADAATLSIDAQEFAFDNMARMLKGHLKRPCEIVRFPTEKVPAALVPYLGLDDTRAAAVDALVNQAISDADMLNARCANALDETARVICSVFDQAPARSEPAGAAEMHVGN